MNKRSFLTSIVLGTVGICGSVSDVCCMGKPRGCLSSRKSRHNTENTFTINIKTQNEQQMKTAQQKQQHQGTEDSNESYKLKLSNPIQGGYQVESVDQSQPPQQGQQVDNTQSIQLPQDTQHVSDSYTVQSPQQKLSSTNRSALLMPQTSSGGGTGSSGIVDKSNTTKHNNQNINSGVDVDIIASESVSAEDRNKKSNYKNEQITEDTNYRINDIFSPEAIGALAKRGGYYVGKIKYDLIKQAYGEQSINDKSSRDKAINTINQLDPLERRETILNAADMIASDIVTTMNQKPINIAKLKSFVLIGDEFLKNNPNYNMCEYETSKCDMIHYGHDLAKTMANARKYVYDEDSSIDSDRDNCYTYNLSDFIKI